MGYHGKQKPRSVRMSRIGSSSAASEADASHNDAGRGIRRFDRWFPLSRFLRPLKWPILLAMLVLSLGAAAELSVAVAFREVVDTGLSKSQGVAANRYFFQFLIVILVLGGATYGRTLVTGWIGERFVKDIRRGVFDQVLRLSSDYFDRTSSGEILSRLTADVSVLQELANTVIPAFTRSIFITIGGSVAMILISHRLTVALFAMLSIIAVPFFVGGRIVRRRARLTQEKLGEVTRHTEEVLNGIQTVQAFNYEPVASRINAAKLEETFLAAIRRVRVTAGLNGVVVLNAIKVILVVLSIGVRDLVDGRMTAGELTAFVFLALMVAGNIAVVSHVWAELSRASGAADRIAELLAVKPTIETPSNPVALPAPSQGLLQFRDVGFCYPERPGVSVLKDFNLEVLPGETVAIVGPSGAGKSSVFKLILRFYDPSDGEVRIDGVNIRDVDPTALRSVVSLIPQDPEVFSGTALENIRFGLSSAIDEQVRAAARSAAAAGFIEAMPGGYESLLGPSGRLLSGGQRQRLAIARAILRDASLLLFDEATSSLDSESEALIQQSLAAMAGQRTVIIIAHRLATVRHADRIVVMEDGRIVAVGAHNELLKQGGLYTRLARSQFAGAPG
jgi:ATP-binding cassette subfamily B protein